ncbi:VWA domain-containing protein [Desulfoluna spongiiphila]|uniref:Ca-activated chloride channel family protein n=1 Tax=Desulfoluna spongiiphila TaxID=419481 RepID=A0A1G5FYN4_9BACT|nr:VWA domain-containing protein [Desulfoluna spongiiphila]SCY44207.1 Ca-activated chloride channel family protein [Desulfoluna spongiiphila]
MTHILNTFHFLRPFWLLALFPALGLALLILRRQDARSPYEGVIAAHLLTHLMTGEDAKNRVRPAGLLIAFWFLATFAMAGPSWKKAPSPFTEDTSALVIAVKVTPSMTAEDIQPSRLDRASHKIGDLLALRPGSRTALVAYAGSAHLVMPLTRDAAIITTFSGELSPEIMPEEGDQAAAALALAAAQLEKNGQPGSILLIADAVNPGQLKALKAHRAEHRFPVHILAVAADKGVPVPPDSPPAPPLDSKMMKQAADAVGGSLTIISPDDRDINALNRRIESTPVDTGPAEEGELWQDSGYWLVPLLALLSLMWFRPGWRVRWR